MGKLVLIAAAAVLLAGFLIWKAEATPLAGAAMIGTTIKSESLIQNAGCHKKGKCPLGTHLLCGTPQPGHKGRLCECAPC